MKKKQQRRRAREWWMAVFEDELLADYTMTRLAGYESRSKELVLKTIEQHEKLHGYRGKIIKVREVRGK